MNILITGSGGFIGGHLVKRLSETSDNIITADLKPLDQWFQVTEKNNVKNFHSMDLRSQENCKKVITDVNVVFNLACDHGGIGHIMNNSLESMKDILINTNLIIESSRNKVSKFLFSSSACVYNTSLQESVSDMRALKESDAYPAQPDSQYGWEKLFSEMLCMEHQKEFGIKVYLPRIHGCYGPNNHFDDGKEKAPNALIRKSIEAKLLDKDSIDVWGDGKQTRSFMYVDDCIEGLLKLLDSDHHEPINLGNNNMVSIDECVDVINQINNSNLKKNYQINETQGVRARNSDNSKLIEVLNWEPKISISQGFEKLYNYLYPLVENKISNNSDGKNE